MAAAVTVTNLLTGDSTTHYFGSVRAAAEYVNWIIAQDRPVHIHSF